MFSEETDLTLTNVTINNVTSNHKNIITSTYNNFKLYNTTFNNINLYGDYNDSALIEISMDTLEKNIILDNVQLLNIKSNGGIITINGIKATIQLNNLTMKDIISYEPIIKSTLNNVNSI